MQTFAIPKEELRRGIPLHTFEPEIDKHYNKPVNLIYVGVSGNLVVETITGEIVTFTDVPQGKEIVGFFTKILGSTTAGSLVAQRL